MFRCNLHSYLKWFGIVTVLPLCARLYVIYALHGLPVEHGVHSSDAEASVVMAEIRNMEKTNVWSVLCTVAVMLSLLLFHGSIHTTAAHSLLIAAAAAPPIWNVHSKKKKRMYLWWGLCTLYLHACQVRVTVGDSGLHCCTCVTTLEC